jgi:hypothetical protein
MKSLALDGSPCDADTVGLLRRALIVAGNVIPVGKETDRHWEQGEDPSMMDFDIQVMGRLGNWLWRILPIGKSGPVLASAD